MKDRYQNQIAALLEVFGQVKEGPGALDSRLSGYFRKHKKYGSKDRRFIQGAIFGYYRWFGWLRKMELDEERGLLWGYLLENLEIDPLIHHWAERLGLGLEFLRGFECPDRCTLEVKWENALRLVPDLSVKDLNPDFFPSWPIETHRAFQERAELWLRLNEPEPEGLFSFLEERGVTFERDERVPSALKVIGRVNLQECPAYRAGAVEVQDFTSQLVSLVAAPAKGEAWLDFCAGAGGKSLHLASLVGASGRVLAMDVREQALKEAKKRIERAGLENIGILHWGGQDLPEEAKGDYDGVMVDAPCSTTGVLRRSPWIRWEITEEKVIEYQALQLSILEKARELVRPGGKLVYVTCSILPAENEEVVERFLSKNDCFRLLPFTNPLDQGEAEGMANFLPPQTPGDGMFVAVMIKG